MDGDTVRVGLLGCGNVGGALARLLDRHADLVRARAGAPIRITRVAVRHPERARDVPLDPAIFGSDPAAVVRASDVDVVVEVMGTVDPARGLVLEALAAGKPVVTANKELLAVAGPELFAAAEAAGVDLLFEASVAGGIPLMRPLRESLAGDRIRRVMGIVNGTTNFILTRMTETGAAFADALAEAQALGFAEADPTADVEGHDAASKAAIIATIAFGARVSAADVYREGITSITADDIASARDLGYVVKLLAVAEDLEDSEGEDEDEDEERGPGVGAGGITVRVHPAMVPVHHPLASVRESFNALFIEADAVGELMLYGRGAGGMPTASAVLGDLVDAARNLLGGSRGATMGTLDERPVRPVDDIRSQYYLMLEVADRPGVLAAIAERFGEHRVSIKSMRQQGIGEDARIIFVTHTAREANLRATLDALTDVDAVHRVGSMLRVMGDEP